MKLPGCSVENVCCAVRRKIAKSVRMGLGICRWRRILYSALTVDRLDNLNETIS
jgi:hypothetical protein